MINNVTKIQKPEIRLPIIQSYDVVYRVVPGVTPAECRQLHMSIIVPRSETPLPLIMVYPGGGFKTADWHLYLSMRLAMAKAGYVVACAEYRTVPDCYPALVQDAKAALRYMRANASVYNVDKSKAGVIGLSAGGYVSNMMGATVGENQYEIGDHLSESTDVDAVATLYGISDLRNIGDGLGDEIEAVHHSVAAPEALLVNGIAWPPANTGASVLSDPQKVLNASPMGHLKAKMPPFLLMAGTDDHIVSPVQSEQWYRALSDADQKVELVMLQDAGHENDPCWAQDPINTRLIEWFDGYLK